MNPVFLFSLYVGLLGLLVGSFLNVVILRFPQALETESLSLLQLLLPRAHCPKCLKTIAWYDNIPLFSYLNLRGKCRHCQKTISKRYPAIEALTAFLSFWAAQHFGFNLNLLAALCLIWSLIALLFIDLDHMLLPDDITLPVLWLGLLFNVFNIFTSAQSAILGAAGGYSILWGVYWIFKIIARKEGMGYGDFKLLALLGAWLGWQALPFIILLSSLLGSSVGILLMLFRGQTKNTPIPFGPFLAIAGFIALFWGQKINQFYLNLIF